MDPLSGIRVLDFSRQTAGAGGTRYLANLGAEILRVEWPEPPGLDFVRFINPADGVEGLNRGGMFADANIGKRSFTINMGTESGRQLIRRLIPKCDVFYENMTPRVMKAWNLTYDEVRALRDDIIYVSCSGFGQSGPTAHYRSYGGSSAAHTGLVQLAGLPGRPPAGWGFAMCDPHAAINNAMVVLLALQSRTMRGRGVYIDSAQTQVNVTLNTELFLQHSVKGTTFRTDDFPPGNRRRYPAVAPHNAYPCLGEDKWCVISVFSEEEWHALKRVMQNPDWAESPLYDTSSNRWSNQESLDKLLADWTRRYDRYVLVELLQREGVRAGVVQNIRDRMQWDAQLAHRGTYAVFDHPEVGPRRHPTVAARLSKNPYRPQRAAPRLGQDNDYVFKDLLELSTTEIDGLKAEGVIRYMPGVG